jgi:cytochrome c-type biogenesis protein CcmF
MLFEPGRGAVLAGLVCAALSAVLYLASLKRRGKTLGAARALLAVSALASAFVFIWLMHLVAAKRFEYRYVFDYVSLDLHGAFLYAASWAGQEGSFALWALCTGLIGLLVAWRAREWEARVMPLYLTNLIALFAIMHILSPFALVPKETGPRPDDLMPGLPWPPPWPPADGNGLNPSLQNIWMAIHPPTIFFGFASLAVPFAYALSTLLWRSYEEWVSRVRPYVM